MEKYDLIIKNGAVVLADKVVDNCAIAVKDGKIAALMNQTQQRKTPLQQSLDDFSKKLAIFTGCLGRFDILRYKACRQHIYVYTVDITHSFYLSFLLTSFLSARMCKSLTW